MNLVKFAVITAQLSIISLAAIGNDITNQLPPGENFKIILPTEKLNITRVIMKNTTNYDVTLKFKIYNLPNKNDTVGEGQLFLRSSEISDVNIKPFPGKVFVNPIYVSWTWLPGDINMKKDPTNFLIPISNADVSICQSPDGPLTTHKSIPESIDFCAPYGSNIVAAKDGYVTLVIDGNTEGGNDPKYASKSNRIFLLHEDGSLSTYDHLAPNTIRVKKDAFIKKGELLGQVGMTGQTSGPHLHFAVIYYDQELNERYLAPKFINSSNIDIPLTYKLQIKKDGSIIKNGTVNTPNDTTQCNASQNANTLPTRPQIFTCKNESSSKYCDTTKIQISSQTLKEYKGNRLWANFKELKTESYKPSDFFIGLDDTRGALIKIECTSDSKLYKAYWGWKNSELSKVRWILIPGDFIRQ